MFLSHQNSCFCRTRTHAFVAPIRIKKEGILEDARARFRRAERSRSAGFWNPGRQSQGESPLHPPCFQQAPASESSLCSQCCFRIRSCAKSRSQSRSHRLSVDLPVLDLQGKARSSCGLGGPLRLSCLGKRQDYLTNFFLHSLHHCRDQDLY